jgi:hypothetical protein
MRYPPQPAAIGFIIFIFPQAIFLGKFSLLAFMAENNPDETSRRLFGLSIFLAVRSNDE